MHPTTKSPLQREGFVLQYGFELRGGLPRLLHQQVRRNDVPVHVRELRRKRRRNVLVGAVRLLRQQVHRVVPEVPAKNVWLSALTTPVIGAIGVPRAVDSGMLDSVPEPVGCGVYAGTTPPVPV